MSAADIYDTMLAEPRPAAISPRARVVGGAVGIILVVSGAGCGNSLPAESDLPPESALVYPGAVEIHRIFDDGETGTYIEGGSADRAPRLNASYGLSGVDREELFNWYEGQLQQRGWTITRRSQRDLGATKDPDGDLHFNLGITAGIEDFDTYSIVLVLASDN